MQTTTMHRKSFDRTAAICLFALTSGLATAETTNSGDWCQWLQSKPGTLYKNAENPFLQSFNIGGRFQYQAAYIDGEDVNGRDFNDTYDDYRRVRLESKIEFLQYFAANIKLNMVNDSRPSGGDLDWGYDTFDEAIFTFNLGKAFGTGPFDELKLNYGRFKINMTEEVHMSSKDIMTIERSALANKLYGVNNRARRHARCDHGQMVGHPWCLQQRG